MQGAIGEGILATGSLKGGAIGDVHIEHNRVVGNNLGGIPPSPSSPYPQCAANGQIPGDCGEGIHLMGVHNSKVADNYVSGNEGGVLLTDEFGPTHNNLVMGNTITKNAFDCGVTAPGHNPFALDANGNPQPAVAGVYDNVIRDNRITDNGLQGEGAGVLFANAGPGTASYDNRVEGNFISGNELSAVTMHAHTLAPGQFEDLNGNRIVRNTIGPNNLGSAAAGPGDSLDGSVTDPFTTGVLVFSGTVPVQVKIVGQPLLRRPLRRVAGSRRARDREHPRQPLRQHRHPRVHQPVGQSARSRPSPHDGRLRRLRVRSVQCGRVLEQLHAPVERARRHQLEIQVGPAREDRLPSRDARDDGEDDDLEQIDEPRPQERSRSARCCPSCASADGSSAFIARSVVTASSATLVFAQASGGLSLDENTIFGTSRIRSKVGSSPSATIWDITR